MKPDAENTPTKEEVAAYFRDDRFATGACGIRIDECTPGVSSVCSFELSDNHRNAMGNIMGGALFTLADFTCSTAVYAPDGPFVSIDSGMRFISSARGTHITARADVDRMGGRIAYVHAAIEDELGTLVARAHFTFARVSSNKA